MTTNVKAKSLKVSGRNTIMNKLEEDGKNDTNYFRIKKEIEKEQNSEEKPRKSNKENPLNLTEKIYLLNSEKLGKYYYDNKNNLLLYGSKKYDLLTIKRLVKEMSKYKSKVLKKISEDKKRPNKLKDFGIDSCDDKAILTPLADSDKKKNKNMSESLEKKNFEEAQRSAVVMRRIEYTHLLESRDSFKKGAINTEEEDKKFFLLIKEAVDKIERNWLYHHWKKLKQMTTEKDNKNNNNKDDNNKNDTNKINNYKINNNNKNKNNQNNQNNQNNKNNDNNNINNDNNNINNNTNINNINNDEIQKKYLGKLKAKNNNIKKQIDFIKEHFYFQLLRKNLINKINNIRIINKQNNLCFIKKLIDRTSLNNKQQQVNKLKELESELIESKNNYLKVKSLLEDSNIENNNLKAQLDEELSNNKKEKEKLLNDNKETNNKLDQMQNENNKLKNNHDSLNENYNQVLNDNNKLKKELDDAINNNKLLMEKIINLNNSINTKDEDNEKKNNELQTVLNIITTEKENKDDEIKNIKSDLEDKTKLINSYEEQINNLNNEISEKNKINEINLEKNKENKKNLEEYNNKINLLEKEKEDLKNSIQILEEISNSNKDKYNKLYFQNKNDFKKFNKEQNELNNEISKLKQKLDYTKKNEEKEKSDKLELFKEKDKYEKKINNLNEIIEELKIRIQNLYYQLSFFQKNNKFNINADIVVKLKLMILLIRNYLDRNIIFDKREFFNILMRKYGKRYYSKEKRVEYLRDYRQNNFPF